MPTLTVEDIIKFEEITIFKDDINYGLKVNSNIKIRIVNGNNPGELKSQIFDFMYDYNCFKIINKKLYLDLKIFIAFYKLQNLILNLDEDVKLYEKTITIGNKNIKRYILLNYYVLGFVFGDGSSGFIANKSEKDKKGMYSFSITYSNKLKYISVSGKDLDIITEVVKWYSDAFHIDNNCLNLIVRFDNEQKLSQFGDLLKKKSYVEIHKIFDMDGLEIIKFIENMNIDVKIGMAKKGKSDERFGSGITLYIENELASIVSVAFKNWKFILNLYNEIKDKKEAKMFAYNFLAGIFDADGWVDPKGFSIRSVIYSYLVEKNYVLGKKDKETYYDDWKIGILLDIICEKYFKIDLKLLVRTDNLGTGFNFSDLTEEHGIKTIMSNLSSFIKNEDAIMVELKQIIEIFKKYLNDIYYTRKELDEKYPGWREEKEHHFSKSQLKTKGIITKINLDNAQQYFQLVKNDCDTCKIISKIFKEHENGNKYKKFIITLLVLSKKLSTHGKMENGHMLGGYQTGGLGVHLSVSNSKEIMQTLFEYSRYKRKKNDIKIKTPYIK
jgi:hypothetical protein